MSPSRIVFLMKFETEGCGVKKEKCFEEYIGIKEGYFYTTLTLPPNSEFLIRLSHALQTISHTLLIPGISALPDLGAKIILHLHSQITFSKKSSYPHTSLLDAFFSCY